MKIINDHKIDKINVSFKSKKILVTKKKHTKIANCFWLYK